MTERNMATNATRTMFVTSTRNLSRIMSLIHPWLLFITH